MRAMRVGDLAFFYHSNCTTPGIVGVMRIAEEHQIDETAFDPNHPYFDPKSTREKPKWEMVKVEFVKKFEEMLTLKELKSFAAPGGALSNMQMIKQSRLSVSSVQPEEWEFILEQIGERYDLGHGVDDVLDESGTDGERLQGEDEARVSDGGDDKENRGVYEDGSEGFLPDGEARLEAEEYDADGDDNEDEVEQDMATSPAPEVAGAYPEVTSDV
jgi:predicted RNA-binding protein with PUA-like domain